MSIRLFGSPYGSMWDDPWARDFFDFPTPSRIFNQHFGQVMNEDDFLPPVLVRGRQIRPRANNRPPQGTGMSQFNVKVVDNRVVISGKHEEKQDEHGFIKREFTRQYMLPKDVDPASIKSTLSHDGVLSVSAPKLAIDPPKERPIPIEHVKGDMETQ